MRRQARSFLLESVNVAAACCLILLMCSLELSAQCNAQVSAVQSGQIVTLHVFANSPVPNGQVYEIKIFVDDRLSGSPLCFTGATCSFNWDIHTGCMIDGSHTARVEAWCSSGTGQATTGFGLSGQPSIEITNSGVDAEGFASGQVIYDFLRGTGTVSWTIETPGGSTGGNPVIFEPAGALNWSLSTSCWPPGSYQMTARARRCSGEEAVAQSVIVVPPHQPTVTLSVLDSDKSQGIVEWSFPQTSADYQRHVRVELEPGGGTVVQTGVFVARNGQATFPLPSSCGIAPLTLRARALACNDLQGGLAETTLPLAAPKCETKCCGEANPANCVADPVHVVSGNMRLTDSDPLPGTLVAPLQRTYDSRNPTGVIGRGWASVFDAWLATNGIRDTLDRVHIQSESGERFIFVREGSVYRQVWPVPTRAPGSLVRDPSGDFHHREDGSNIVRVFRDGRIVALREVGSDHEIGLAYDANGRPSAAADSRGSWRWTIATNGATGRITSIAVDGHPDLQWTYTPDGSGLLTAVSTPAGLWRTYTYNAGVMETARDGTGHLIESHLYDGSGQALTSSGGAGEVTNIGYDLPGRVPGEWRTHVNYASGRTTDFYSRFIAGQMRTVQIDGSCDCGSEDGVWVYDAAGHVVREQDARGYVRLRQYTQDRLTEERTHLRPASCDPETDPLRCRLDPSLLATAILTDTNATQTVSFEYANPTWPDRVTRTTTASIIKPGATRQETFTYDNASGATISHSVSGWTDSPLRQETRTTTTSLYNGTEGAAFNPGAWFPNAWRTLPQPAKQRKSINGPRPGNGDTTSFVYYPVDPAVPATWRGRLAATRSPAGLITRFETYDVFGNATRIVDPNGVATESTYDSLGRQTATTLQGVPGCDTTADPLCGSDVTTTRNYAGTGPLESDVRPGSATSYTYDDRGRILTSSRGPTLGDARERVESSYDPVTALKTLERVLAFEGGSWVEKKRETYTYNDSDQLSRVTHPDGTSVEYSYGAGSQLQSVRDENHTAPNTFYDYGPGGRLQKVTQVLSTASGGAISTTYGYDRDGNLTSVTDPNGNVTTYLYDDFGAMVEQLSPVTGRTRYKDDAAGNLLSTTTADGTVTTRTYDSLGRVLSATSARAERSESVTWTYDAGAFGKGRLTSMADPTGATAYTYDRRGLLLSETKTIGSAVYMTAFGYDADGNRSRIRYPSGRVVAFAFDYASRPVTAATEGTPLVLSASYLPFGPLRELVFGNGTTRTMTYDQRYRLLTNRLTGPLTSGEGEETSGVLSSHQYAYDPAGNITGIADLADPAFDRNFGYDDLNRLTTAIGGSALWGAGSYTYDAMGNMRSSSVGASPRTFAMAGTTPKIASVESDGRVENVSYDANGNEIAVGAQTYTYTPRNSLQTAGDRVYEYDGRGIRTTTHYAVTLASFTLDAGTAAPGQTVTGMVSLTAIAPPGGIAVRLQSSSAAFSVPGEVLIAAGNASATFTARVSPDATAQTLIVTATYATSLPVSLAITNAPALVTFSAAPAQVVAGDPVTVAVTLAEAAGEGGAVVAIGSEREAIAGGTITVSPGATSGSSVLETFAVPSAVTVLLTASYGGTSLEASVQVQPAVPAANRLVLAPDGVLGGDSATGRIHLVDPVPSVGRTFQLTSSHPNVAQLPSSITIGGDCDDGDGGGGTCPDGMFTIATAPVATETPVTITATDGTITLTAELTVICPTGPTPQPSFPAGETIFIDDVLPSGAVMSGALRWDLAQKASGELALVAPYAGSGLYQSTINGLAEPLGANEKLFAYVRVADCASPRQIVLRARVGGQWVSAYWGEPLMPADIHMGAVPAGGTWQRLDLLLRDLGGEGDPLVTDLELAHVDGQVWFDRLGRTAECVAGSAERPAMPNDEDVWIDDDVPAGVTFENTSNGPLQWSSAQAASGAVSLVHPYRGQNTYVTGIANLAQPLVAGSKLSLYALVDSCSPPVRQIHIRITTTAGSRTVSWGDPIWDSDESTVERGPVPASGAWTRLEVPLDTLQLDSGTLTRIDVAHVDGRVWFDRIALWPVAGARITSFVSDHESTVSVGTTVTWTATATGTVPPLEYRFERRDDLGNWSIVQNYGMQTSYTWTPTAMDVGTNAVRVSVRNGGSAADFEDTATLQVRVVEGEEGLLLRDPEVRMAWWRRWFRPRIPAAMSIGHGPLTTTSEGVARRHSLYTPELQLLAETEITPSTTPSIAYEYVWFAGQPLAQIATATGTIDWYFNDHLGTPILQTDAEAGVAWRVEHDPYGTVFSTRSGAGKHQPLRLPGQENEGIFEPTYNIFRWYRAGWGRYTQSDPLGVGGLGHFRDNRLATAKDPRLLPGFAMENARLASALSVSDINPYGYAAANPLSFIDPKGLETILCTVHRLTKWAAFRLCEYVGVCIGTVSHDFYLTAGFVHVQYGCRECSRICFYEIEGNTVEEPKNFKCVPPMPIVKWSPDNPMK